MELTCRECGGRLDIKEIEKAGSTCPLCKKETSWFTDPEFFGFDEE
ncbi:MAG: hypothetical protein WC867_04920 [Candidatus Pacearchaeota archaeon]|jgi:predicted Zn-ribbon and HTH transcriptional regulator